MSDTLKKPQWEESYRRSENFLFYPNEEILRFFSRRVAKRVGPTEFSYFPGFSAGLKVLDFGCGIGRHVKFLHEFGFDGYGADLSSHAIDTGRKWLASCGIADADDRLRQADGRELPFADGFFDMAISHGVLDSMPFAVALDCMQEIRRVLKPGVLFYLDLISNDDSEVEPGFAGELVVQKQHEVGTIQSYFDEAKIDRLLGADFELLDKVHVQRRNISGDSRGSRYHIVTRRL